MNTLFFFEFFLPKKRYMYKGSTHKPPKNQPNHLQISHKPAKPLTNQPNIGHITQKPANYEQKISFLRYQKL